MKRILNLYSVKLLRRLFGMNSYRIRPFWSLVFIAVFGVCDAVLLYFLLGQPQTTIGWFGTEMAELENRLSFFESIILFQTLLCLAWYTIETWSLRRISEAALLAQRQEIVRAKTPKLSLSSPVPQDHDQLFTVTNSGAVALDTVVHNLSDDSKEVGRHRLPLFPTQSFTFLVAEQPAIHLKNVLRLTCINNEGDTSRTYYLYEFLHDAQGTSDHKVRLLNEKDNLIQQGLRGELTLNLVYDL